MGLIIDLLCHYVFITPAVILAGLVFKLPFITTYVIMLVVDDVSKLIISIPYYRTMKWIKPVAMPELIEREEALIESGGEPTL
jgi:hypothetical protein